MTVRSSGMTVVGIDLGTTNSLVAVMGPEGPETIANELGDHLTPSVVAIAEDGGVLVGRAAKDRLVAAPDSGRAFFKRDMGTRPPTDSASAPGPPPNVPRRYWPRWPASPRFISAKK